MARRIRQLFVFLLAVVAFGCGVKGDPVPPRSSVPEAIKDLKILCRNARVVLQWSIPRKDTDGKQLSGLAGFRVWRRIVAPDDDACPTCPEKYDTIAEIDYQTLQSRQEGKEIITFWDDEKKKEEQYRYVVTSFTIQGRESGRSNRVAITWVEPLPPPDFLSPLPGNRTIDLTWNLDQVGGKLLSGVLKGFNVYRRSGGQPYPLTPVNTDVIQGSAYTDISVTNGETYYYIVRAIKAGVDIPIESESSQEAAGTPVDREPPAPPTVAIAFQTEEGVVVLWEPSQEPDLAGYVVYRRLVGEGTPVRISSGLFKEGTRYVDTTFASGSAYYYSVTAVDNAPRPNESDFSQELRVETTGR